MLSAKKKLSLFLPILAIVGAASFGILMTLYIAPNTIGKIVFSASKVLMLFLPILWVVYIDKKKVKIFVKKGYQIVLSKGTGVFTRRNYKATK